MISLLFRDGARGLMSLTKLQVLKRFEFEERLMRSGVVAANVDQPDKPLLFVRGAPFTVERLAQGGVLPCNYHQVLWPILSCLCVALPQLPCLSCYDSVVFKCARDLLDCVVAHARTVQSCYSDVAEVILSEQTISSICTQCVPCPRHTFRAHAKPKQAETVL